MHILNFDEFQMGRREFKKHEKRDPMYKVTTFLIKNFWGSPSDMTDGLGVLLLTWNQAFYRYGPFDLDELEKCITNNFQKIEEFRERYIFTLSSEDEEDIKRLFCEFLDGLKIAEGKSKGRKSPVSVAKALHLLAPNFFPLWDDKIARAYGCYYNKSPETKYIQFCYISQKIADELKDYYSPQEGTLLKAIDEYSYAKYTKKWI